MLNSRFFTGWPTLVPLLMTLLSRVAWAQESVTWWTWLDAREYSKELSVEQKQELVTRLIETQVWLQDRVELEGDVLDRMRTGLGKLSLAEIEAFLDWVEKGDYVFHLNREVHLMRVNFMRGLSAGLDGDVEKMKKREVLRDESLAKFSKILQLLGSHQGLSMSAESDN